MDGGRRHILALLQCHKCANLWNISKMVLGENGSRANLLKVSCTSFMMQRFHHHRWMTWFGMERLSVSRLNDHHSMALHCRLLRCSRRFILVKDATTIEVDWLDACITCIELSTTTSSGEALHDNGTMLFPFKSDKKSLMCLKRLAVFRGI